MKLRTLFSIHILLQNSVLAWNIECKTLPVNAKLKFATVLGKAVLSQVILSVNSRLLLVVLLKA